MVCSSPTCVREQCSPEGTVIPDVVHSNLAYYQAYIDNFQSIAQGLIMIGKVESIFNVRVFSINMKVAVEEMITQIRSYQMFE